MNRIIFNDSERNGIRFSNFSKLESDCPFTGLGIKYVASGEEIYYANNKKYTVKAGDYIIGNDFTKSTVRINHHSNVQGLCIDISSKIIAEVTKFLCLKNDDLEEFLLSDQFFVNRYNVSNTLLGKKIIATNQQIKSGQFLTAFHEREFFYELAELLISDQNFVFHHLNKLSFKKDLTNTEVFRAVLKSKFEIDNHIHEEVSLEKIAHAIGISKFYFIRVFKSTFGISPYQYLRNRRLELARVDLLKGDKIINTAMRYGFSDVFSFSKAFKQYFKMSPGSVRKSNF